MCSECAWDAALKTAEELLEMVEELPEAGEEFASSVDEKTRSIRAWIQEHEHVSEKQVTALDNMHEGAEKWLQR